MGLHRVHEIITIFAIPFRGCVGIGRQPRLRIWWRKPWGFESPHPYETLPGLDGRAVSCTGGGTPSVHRYPLPKSLPSGEGLGGRSRRSPAGEVASLRRCFDSVSVHCQGSYFLLGARTGPSFGPLQAFLSVFCLHRSTFWTYTSTLRASLFCFADS